MHIAEGMLSPAVLGAGVVVATAGVAYGLRRMAPEDTPRVAVLTSAFFVASLVHVPFGPASIHLVLNGLLGLVLGWAAFPAIAVALLLQALFFGFGGLAVLGVNTCVMALPAVLAHYLFRDFLRDAARAPVVGAAVAVLAICGAALLAAFALVLSDQGFAAVATAFALASLPLAAVEAVVCAAAVGFLFRVRPEVFDTARVAVRAAA